MDFIAGSWSETDAPDGAIEDRSPADLSMLLGRFPWAIGQAERAIQAAREAQPGFGALPQQDRARLVPVFTNREAFVRAAGLSNAEHASVLVLDREGKVLARAEGMFDEEKARALRQTLFAKD